MWCSEEQRCLARHRPRPRELQRGAYWIINGDTETQEPCVLVVVCVWLWHTNQRAWRRAHRARRPRISSPCAAPTLAAPRALPNEQRRQPLRQSASL